MSSIPSYSLSTPNFQISPITGLKFKRRTLLVFKFRPRGQKRAKSGKWKTTHQGPGQEGQYIQCFSHSARCRNGFESVTTNSFAMVTGLYQTRFAPRSAVGGISITRHSTSIPTSFRLSFSSPANGMFYSTLLANILESLASTLWLSHASCSRQRFAIHVRLFTTL